METHTHEIHVTLLWAGI